MRLQLRCQQRLQSSEDFTRTEGSASRFTPDASWPEASVTEQVGPSLQHHRAFPRASNPRERAGQQPQLAASVLTRLRYRPSRAHHSVVIQTNTQTMWLGTTKGLNARNPGALWGSPWRLVPGLHGIVSMSSQSKACLSPSSTSEIQGGVTES